MIRLQTFDSSGTFLNVALTISTKRTTRTNLMHNINELLGRFSSRIYTICANFFNFREQW